MKSNWYTFFHTQIVEHPSFKYAVDFARASNFIDAKLKNEGSGCYRLGIVRIVKVSALDYAMEWIEENADKLTKKERKRLGLFL